ncbi:MAG: histidinol dehydrogenase [Tannerella sp.]|nr:histidinol dehydrogenase [Tannerella sp.]
MQTINYPRPSEWKALAKRPVLPLDSLFNTVRQVLGEVQRRGDAAVKAYEQTFDHVQLSCLQVSKEEMEEAEALLPAELKKAIQTAARHIEAFHAAQFFKEITVETAPGVVCRQKALPIEKVGLYVPGGTAPLFSTVLMLGIPARIAGCGEIVLCSPPNKEGKLHPAILFAARVAGVHKLFKAGGIQAIGAMAYGTESVPKVDKLFGPGNQYVTAAKQWINLQGTAIDLPAGPSEVEVIADASAKPDFVAADLLSQAEHGADSQVLLLTASPEIIEPVKEALERQLPALPRKAIAEKALANSRILLMRDWREVMAFTNLYAPEHLIIQTADYARLASEVRNAGSVFLGPYTPESAGDYASGTNHTLPTGGCARAYSGVNLDSFMHKVTFQEISRQGLEGLADTIRLMAAHEQLEAHRKAVTLRME